MTHPALEPNTYFRRTSLTNNSGSYWYKLTELLGPTFSTGALAVVDSLAWGSREWLHWNEKRRSFTVEGISVEPFTEFEYLLLRATDTQEQGTGT